MPWPATIRSCNQPQGCIEMKERPSNLTFNRGPQSYEPENSLLLNDIKESDWIFTLAWDKQLILKLLIISQASMDEQN